MPAESGQFRNKEYPFGLQFVNGLPCQPEMSKNYGLGSAAYFAAGSGNSTNPYFGVADVTPGQSSNVVLIPDWAVPYNMRCYITTLGIDVQGYVNWGVTSPTAGTIPYLAIQDSLGTPAVVCPFNSLKGGAELYWPTSDISVPLVLGPSTVNGPVGTPITTFSYVASTGVITAGAACFVAGLGVGGTARVIDGTGKGQAAFVTVVTDTTHLTVSPPFTGLDATSVIAIDYQAIKTATDSTHSTIQNGGGTPFTANAFDNGYNGVVVVGTGQGAVRPVSASSTAGALTWAYALNTNVDTTTSMIYLTNNNDLNGAIDCCVGDKWATLAVNKGLQAAVNLYSGTTPVGSSVRVYVEGFFAL